MSIPSIVIANAARTEVGSFDGAFGNTPARELGVSGARVLNTLLFEKRHRGVSKRLATLCMVPESPCA
ncbi:hypothetical protein ACXHXG_19850 [Rhizobium sp. LEGMi198b]